MAAAAAPGAGMVPADDNTFMWAFDRLLDCQNLPLKLLTEEVLPAVAGTAQDLPDLVRARLALRLLSQDMRAGRIDLDTIDYLHQLEGCDLSELNHVLPPAALAVTRRAAELGLQAKTEVGLQLLRGDLRLSLEEAEDLLSDAFRRPGDQPCTPDEWDSYELLQRALHDAGTAQQLVAQLPTFHQTLAALYTFAMHSHKDLPSLLVVIQNDIQNGRYVPGAQQQPGAAAGAGPSSQRSPAARRPRPRPPPGVAPAAEAAVQPAVLLPTVQAALPAAAPAVLEEEGLLPMDGDGGHDPYAYESPPRQQQQQPQQRSASQRPLPQAVRELQGRLDDLAQQGGEDPLLSMLGRADSAQRQAGAARGGRPAGARPGRLLEWDSPAVQHPAPELQAARYQRHSPLVLPASGARRHAGRSAAAVEEQEELEDVPRADGTGRRPGKRWSKEEEAALVELVKQYGRGSWATIRDEGCKPGGGLYAGRSNVDLKDKWRNLVKKGLITQDYLGDIESQEERLRNQLVHQRRPGGRPPRFASARKRRRLGDGEETEEDAEEEQEMQEAVEDADAEDQNDDDEGGAAGPGEEDEGQGDGEGEDEGGDEQQQEEGEEEQEEHQQGGDGEETEAEEERRQLQEEEEEGRLTRQAGRMQQKKGKGYMEVSVQRPITRLMDRHDLRNKRPS